jgi:hypothetical protein
MSSAESVTSERARRKSHEPEQKCDREDERHRLESAPSLQCSRRTPTAHRSRSFVGCPLVDTRETQQPVRRARCAEAYRLASTNATLLKTMTPLLLSLTRTTSLREQSCNVCGADFVPAQDAGSRLLSLMPSDREPFSVLMCGGCHSRWSHGVTVSARTVSEASLSPVLRQPPPVA